MTSSSSDGITWTPNQDSTTSTIIGFPASLAYGNGRIVAGLRLTQTGNSSRVVISPDPGLSWTDYSASTGQFEGLVFALGRFIRCELNGRIQTSLDGLNWTVTNSTNPSSISSLATNNNVVVGIGRTSTGRGVISSSP